MNFLTTKFTTKKIPTRLQSQDYVIDSSGYKRKFVKSICIEKCKQNIINNDYFESTRSICPEGTNISSVDECVAAANALNTKLSDGKTDRFDINTNNGAGYGGDHCVNMYDSIYAKMEDQGSRHNSSSLCKAQPPYYTLELDGNESKCPKGKDITSPPECMKAADELHQGDKNRAFMFNRACRDDDPDCEEGGRGWNGAVPCVKSGTNVYPKYNASAGDLVLCKN